MNERLKGDSITVVQSPLYWIGSKQWLIQKYQLWQLETVSNITKNIQKELFLSNRPLQRYNKISQDIKTYQQRNLLNLVKKHA